MNTSRIQRLQTTPRAAGLVIAGLQAETSGIVAGLDEPGDIRAQTRSVLQQADALFHAAGLTREHITRVQIWLADTADFAAMNEVYDAWVSRSHPPARACVGAALADPHYRLEIQVFGYLAP
ncbi:MULTISPECIES: RidA family protein [Yersiniaceae]|uniref:RidA family protein n=1 Tax=Yersiniaceae TaxID=1903411 RepID=UPI000932CE4A|nr:MULTISPECIES: RidA family protein [Yersiniaceae]MDV5139293.1 RidA family protein [Chimaeribacter arupi]PLR30692.1 RidA family protein [Chimaeribacter arupi]